MRLLGEPGLDGAGVRRVVSFREGGAEATASMVLSHAAILAAPSAQPSLPVRPGWRRWGSGSSERHCPVVQSYPLRPGISSLHLPHPRPPEGFLHTSQQNYPQELQAPPLRRLCPHPGLGGAIWGQVIHRCGEAGGGAPRKKFRGPKNIFSGRGGNRGDPGTCAIFPQLVHDPDRDHGRSRSDPDRIRSDLNPILGRSGAPASDKLTE